MALKNLAVKVSKPYDADELFNPFSPLNRDNCLAPLHYLKQRIEMIGGYCHTYDVINNKKLTPDIVLFLDCPRMFRNNFFLRSKSAIRKWVILNETEVVLPLNWDLKCHSKFEKIFTWNDDLVDNKKYFKINFSNTFPEKTNKDLSVKNKFCAMIAGNKKAAHPLELYSKRIEAVRWFEKYHPEDFDLYGIGWDEYRFEGPRAVRVLNRVNILTKLLVPHFPSYQGRIVNKRDILSRYKFSICYENARDIPGYITEKIFDCFFAGCVPVYWGANNVTDHIPENCFIDKRKFESYEMLYDYMKNMSAKEYMCYLDNIEMFLKSEKAYQFSAQAFAEIIIREMVNG